MGSVDRRELVLKELIESAKPLKGTDLAEHHGVTRQVIVKDIAILRAKGHKIIATPDGYMIGKFDNKIKRVIAVNHDEDGLEEELNIVIRYGGIVEDVVVEHPIYGEIRGMLMVKNLNDLENFLSKYRENKAKLLLFLTNGVHIHTIATDTEESMNLILNKLREKGFLIE